MVMPDAARACAHCGRPVKQHSNFLRAHLQDGADARTGYIITVPQPLTPGTTTVSLEAVARATVMEFNGAANRFERSSRKKVAAPTSRPIAAEGERGQWC
jgi:hypothetical protein